MVGVTGRRDRCGVDAAAPLLLAPPHPAPRPYKSGPRLRVDVERPQRCPLGHEGAVITFDRMSSSDPWHARASWRCTRRHARFDPARGEWVHERHRFVLRDGDDPLPQRHPTHDHPHQPSRCLACQRGYRLDQGLRVGHGMGYAVPEIASLEMAVGEGATATKSAVAIRKAALRYQPPTRAHRRWADEDPEALEAMSAHRVATGRDPYWSPLRDPPGEPEEGSVVVAAGDWPEPGDDEPEWPFPDLEAEEPEREGLLGLRPARESWHGLAFEDLLDRPPREAVLGDDDFISRSFALAGEYIDQFAPAIVARNRAREWPEAVVVDSLPLNRYRPEEGEDPRAQSDYLCEVWAAVDATPGTRGVRRRPPLLALYPAGGRDKLSAVEFLATLDGAPRWIVTDGDPALAEAISARFPRAIQYRCEEHLRDDALEAARADGAGHAWLLAAIRRCQLSKGAWNQLVRMAGEMVPPEKEALRTWMRNNSRLVMHQMVLRDLFPGYPRGSGAVEQHLVFVREKLETRRRSLANRRRLVLVLELMRDHRNGTARHAEYCDVIQAQLEGRGAARIPWRDAWDHWRPRGSGRHRVRNTIIEHRDAARRRALLDQMERDRRSVRARVTARMGEAREAAAAAGGGATGRARRDTERARVSARGRMVADVPELMRCWDFQANGDADPATIAAGSSAPRHWVCQEHAAGGASGAWPGHLHRWTQSPGRRAASGSGCPFCMRSRVCPGNCLRATHPHLAEEWDAANAPSGLTPDNVFYGSHREVLWTCPNGHGPYPMGIHLRSVYGRSCKPCAKAEGQAKRAASMERRKRARIEGQELRARGADPPFG